MIVNISHLSTLDLTLKRRKKWRKNKEKEVRGQREGGRLQGMGRGGRGSQRAADHHFFITIYLCESVFLC